jgi:hypothetical protein
MVSERASQRALFGVSALLFAASATVTIVWYKSMWAMGWKPTSWRHPTAEAVFRGFDLNSAEGCGRGADSGTGAEIGGPLCWRCSMQLLFSS